jgi:hypothetical protein
MKPDQLRVQISRGAGQGHLDDYVSMWQLNRRNITRFGIQATGPMPGYHRASSFRQQAHRDAGLVALWSGALDARENFPLGPFPHPHPLSDWPLGEPVEHPCHGLLDLADDQRERNSLRRRARHGHVPEVTLMITCGDQRHPQSTLLACTSAKAESDGPFADSESDVDRARKYAMANNMRFFPMDTECLGRTLMANLLVCSFAVNAVRREIAPDLARRIEDLLLRRLEQDTIFEAVSNVSAQLATSDAPVWTVFKDMEWRQAVDIDLRRQIFHTEALVPGGRALRASLRRMILGDMQ